MYTYNHWITDIEQPTTAKAFTYTIWFPSLGQRYIGYKTVSDKSKWLTYTSSSRPVNKLLSKGHTAVYRIIKWFDNADDARKEEIAAMTTYNVTNRSEYLNQCISGVKFGTAGNTISAETRAKLSAAGKGRTHTDEARAKMSVASKGRPKSTEHREKLSAARQNISAEARAKISAALKGKTHTAESRDKMRASKQIGLYVTPLGTFKSLTEASIAHSCSLMTISYRCKSTSPKFNDWAFFKY